MESLIENMSPFGKFQKLILTLIGFTSILTAMTVFSTVFTAARPNFSCTPLNKQQEISNNTLTSTDETCTLWKKIQLNQSVAYDCHYDQKHYGSTIVTEWNLICDRNFYASLTVTFFMIGTFCALFIGYLSDQFGRKRVSLVLLATLSTTLIICQSLQFEHFGLSNEVQYLIYLIAQIFIGACSNGIFSVTFVLLMELTTPKYSTLLSNVNLYMFVFGELIIALVAYFSRNWHVINWFMILYCLVIFLLCLIFLPESPRFLIQHKKYTKLEIELKRIAKMNKREHYIDSGIVANIFDPILQENKDENEYVSNENSNTNTSILSYIFKSKDQLVKTLFLGFIWFSLSMTYYGVSLGITNVGTINPYLMYTLGSVSEMVGYTLCNFTYKFKRKLVFIGFLGLASLTCLAVSLIQFLKDADSLEDEETLSLNVILLIIFTFLGKAMTSAAFSLAYVYTSQMYPTRVRNTLLLFVSSIGRLGSVISPQVNLLGDLVLKQLPYFIFSMCSMVGCIFILILPDPSLLNYF